MMEREHVPVGWLPAMYEVMTGLDTSGVTAAQATLQIVGRLPDIKMKLRVWQRVDDEKLVLVQGMVSRFNLQIMHTCERCSLSGSRRKFEGARDMILCEEHVGEG